MYFINRKTIFSLIIIKPTRYKIYLPKEATLSTCRYNKLFIKPLKITNEKNKIDGLIYTLFKYILCE